MSNYHLRKELLNCDVLFTIRKTIKQGLEEGLTLEAIADKVNNLYDVKRRDRHYTPWSISYIIKLYNLDSAGVMITPIEEDIVKYADHKDRLNIISNIYFNGINQSFIDGVYKAAQL